jgi:hypothetical protein
MDKILIQPPRKVIFLHVLKTGGMTFRGILSSIYGESFHVCADPSIDSIKASLKRFDCVEFHALPLRGDFAFMHSELVKQRRWDLLQGTDVFTMFREPLDQMVSLYFHLVKKRAYVEMGYKANNVPFPGSLDEFIDCPWHFNNQLAFLVGNYLLSTKTELGREDLTEAKGILRRLRVHAGLTERFADSLHIFERVTGQCIPYRNIGNRNQNPDRPALDDIPSTVKKRIEDRSALDTELYEFARQLFSEDLAQCGPSPIRNFGDVVALKKS